MSNDICISLKVNTYQAYLKDSFSRVAVDFLRAERMGFKFAAKIVRGAYMFQVIASLNAGNRGESLRYQERDRALDHGYDDPIQPNLQSTHNNYDNIVAKLLSEVPKHSCRLMVASHNENSIRNAVTKLFLLI